MDNGNNNSDLSGFGTAFAIQTSITAGVLIVFSFFLRPFNKTIYEPRSLYAAESKKPPPLTRKPLSWFLTIRKTDTLNSVDKIGLDAVMFLRFIKFGIHFFLLATLFGLPLIFFHAFISPPPETVISSTGQQLDAKPDYSLTILTINNIHFNDVNQDPDFYNFFFVHSTLLWILSFWCYYNLYVVWNNYIELKARWFKSEDFVKAHHNKTLLVTGLPHYKTTEELENHFETLFGRKTYKDYFIGRESHKYTKLVEEHLKYTKMLEKSLITFLQSKNGKRPRHKEGGKYVDTIEFASEKINSLETSIYDLRVYGAKKLKRDCSAFVSFDSISSCHQAAKSLDNPNSTNGIFDKKNLNNLMGPNNLKKFVETRVKLCPDYEDIIWSNIGLSKAIINTRRLFTAALFIGLIFGWTFLVGFVTAITQVETFKHIPALYNFIETHQAATIFFSSILGPLLFATLNLLLPIILRYLTMLQGVKSYQGVEKSVLKKYFFFLIYQFFLTTGVTTLIFTYFTSFKINFNGAGQQTGLYYTLFMPIAAGFLKFSTTFVILASQSLTGYTMEIAQVFPLLLKIFYSKIFKLTPREEYELAQPPVFYYAVMYGLMCYIFVYATCYSLVAPFIVPFSLVVFTLAYYVMKYQLFYVYETRVETGGSWWPKVSKLILIGMFIFQIITTLVLAMKLWQVNFKNSRGPVIMSLITPFFTFIFWFYVKKNLHLPHKYVEEDFNEVKSNDADDSFDLEKEVYNPAVVKPLPKVWLPSELEAELPKYHVCKYSNLEDFLKQNNQKNYVIEDDFVDNSADTIFSDEKINQKEFEKVRLMDN
ncbi:hypothetical protein HK099_006020, partial [Clydaea vesicula]